MRVGTTSLSGLRHTHLAASLLRQDPQSQGKCLKLAWPLQRPAGMLLAYFLPLLFYSPAPFLEGSSLFLDGKFLLQDAEFCWHNLDCRKRLNWLMSSPHLCRKCSAPFSYCKMIYCAPCCLLTVLSCRDQNTDGIHLVQQRVFGAFLLPKKTRLQGKRRKRAFVADFDSCPLARSFFKSTCTRIRTRSKLVRSIEFLLNCSGSSVRPLPRKSGTRPGGGFWSPLATSRAGIVHWMLNTLGNVPSLEGLD